eukprot:1520525-Lingulodinium_polyedra.AAC.1
MARGRRRTAASGVEFRFSKFDCVGERCSPFASDGSRSSNDYPSERTSGGKSQSETDGGKDTSPSSTIAPGLLRWAARVAAR